MPAIWASSERPLFVRTVWVNGIRHAVLSPDDPVVNPRLCQRPRTSTEKNFPRKHQHIDTRLERLNNCFTNLHVVVEKNFPDSKITPRVVRRQSAPPCSRMCNEKSEGLLEIYVNDLDKLDADRVNCEAFEKEDATSETCAFDCNSESLRFQRNAFSSMTERKQADRSSDAQWNPLSERVLQWLDLSGRAQNYELEMESEESRSSSKVEEDRRWKAVRRRRHLSQTRESSVYAERESSRIVVQNYRLQKSCKLEALAKAAEAKVAQKRLCKIKDATTGDEEHKEESEVKAAEEELKNEDESRNDVMTVWSPPGRLQLHIVMPSFNSDDEKRALSLESLVCD